MLRDTYVEEVVNKMTRNKAFLERNVNRWGTSAWGLMSFIPQFALFPNHAILFAAMNALSDLIEHRNGWTAILG